MLKLALTGLGGSYPIPFTECLEVSSYGWILQVFQATETLTVGLICRRSPASSLFSKQNNVTGERYCLTALLCYRSSRTAETLRRLPLISPPSLPFSAGLPLTNTAFCPEAEFAFLPVSDTSVGLCCTSWLSLPSCCVRGQGAREPPGAPLWDVEPASMPAPGFLVSGVYLGV